MQSNGIQRGLRFALMDQTQGGLLIVIGGRQPKKLMAMPVMVATISKRIIMVIGPY